MDRFSLHLCTINEYKPDFITEPMDMVGHWYSRIVDVHYAKRIYVSPTDNIDKIRLAVSEDIYIRLPLT